jgi:hypothetical protein
MRQAVRVMRRAGYRGVIAIPGLDYANDLSSWLSHEPRDPRHQLIGAFVKSFYAARAATTYHPGS